MQRNQVEYLCEYMLDVRWRPDMDDAALAVLDLCQSKLEIMYLLGAAYFIQHNGWWSKNLPLRRATVTYHDAPYSGIWFVEPWWGWVQDVELWPGPSAMLFVPQLAYGDLRTGEKAIHHDFGVFYGDDQEPPHWTLQFALEIDGYGPHKDRRPQDAYRDNLLPYPVVRLYEEADSPLTWFERIIHASPTNNQSDHSMS
jgi:hypothetical protein